MREIKFKLWDELSRRFIDEGFSISMDGKYIYYEGEIEIYLQDYPHLVLEQYTGLKDKNGKEIYEGDIVRIHNYITTWKHGEPDFDYRIFQIIRNRYTFAYDNSVLYFPLTDYDTSNGNMYDIEVIGNIYENPKLLTDIK